MTLWSVTSLVSLMKVTINSGGWLTENQVGYQKTLLDKDNEMTMIININIIFIILIRMSKLADIIRDENMHNQHTHTKTLYLADC